MPHIIDRLEYAIREATVAIRLRLLECLEEAQEPAFISTMSYIIDSLEYALGEATIAFWLRFLECLREAQEPAFCRLFSPVPDHGLERMQNQAETWWNNINITTECLIKFIALTTAIKEETVAFWLWFLECLEEAQEPAFCRLFSPVPDHGLERMQNQVETWWNNINITTGKYKLILSTMPHIIDHLEYAIGEATVAFWLRFLECMEEV
ncbi:hypothetical protein BGX38DRAFT_1144294 [Terfezia claveryi]|nr:hypothetical protein BGX38DRAFT_1144294 [Terfezia claveryi]